MKTKDRGDLYVTTVVTLRTEWDHYVMTVVTLFLTILECAVFERLFSSVLLMKSQARYQKLHKCSKTKKAIDWAMFVLVETVHSKLNKLAKL